MSGIRVCLRRLKPPFRIEHNPEWLVTRNLVLVLCVLISPCVHASVVVDQANYGVSDTTLILAEGAACVAQTVTAQVTGNLVGVELAATRNESFLTPWVLTIQQVVAGQPTAVTLGATVIAPEQFPTPSSFPPDSVPLSLVVTLANPIFMEAGDQFAIALNPQGVSGSPALLAGGWNGGGANYTGGEVFIGSSPETLQPYNVSDLHFRTIVDVVPEPSSIAIGISALLSMIGFGRRSRI